MHYYWFFAMGQELEVGVADFDIVIRNGLLVDGTGARFELDYTHGVPPVVNDGRLTEIVRGAAVGEFGEPAVTQAVQSWGGDDFAWYGRELPATYVRMGVHDPDDDGPRLDLHAGHFDVDERVIALGVRLMVASVDAFFRAEPHHRDPP